MAACWVPCACCEDAWCLVHQQHVWECPCPEIEGWERSPYQESED